MPGLLDIGPYAGFDPKKSRHLLNNLPRDLSQDVEPFSREYGAGLLSIPGDMVELLNHPVARAIPGFGNQAPNPIAPNAIASAMNVDPQSQNFRAGLLGLPGIEDSARVVAKGLLTHLPEAAAGGKGLLAQALFHGTPHRFDKFDLEAIGTGEGAQAYGHGLYFAENPGVAKSYQHQLTPQADVFVDGKKWGEFDAYQVADEVGIDTVEGNFRVARAHSAMQRVGRHGGVDEAINEIDTIIPGLEKTFPKEVDNLLSEKEFLNKARDRLKVGPKQKGHLYEVDIPDETIGKMLDWDAPLSEQPELQRILSDAGGDIKPTTLLSGKKGLTRVGPDGSGKNIFGIEADTNEAAFSQLTGERAYKILARDLGSEQAASRALNEAGIPGIRFFDGNSRSAGKGTRNIVVFNPDDINEVKRDGELVFSKGRN